MRLLPWLGVVVIASLAPAAAVAQPQSTDRLLNTVVPHAEVRAPFTAENIASALASLAESTGVLLGFETVMEDDPYIGPDQFAWSLRGGTLQQVLDHIVTLDSRYEWRERNGVIHVRPKEAFDDARHFLNRRIPHFELKDALPLHATFELHRLFRGECQIGHPIYDKRREQFLSQQPTAMRKPVSVALDDASVLDIMDAVIKAHGRLYWNVTYRVPPDVSKPEWPMYDYALFAFNDRPATGGWWRMCAGDEDRFWR